MSLIYVVTKKWRMKLSAVCRFSDDQSPEMLHDVIANMTQPNGNTCTGDALKLAHDVIFSPEHGKLRHFLSSFTRVQARAHYTHRTHTHTRARARACMTFNMKESCQPGKVNCSCSVVTQAQLPSSKRSYFHVFRPRKEPPEGKVVKKVIANHEVMWSSGVLLSRNHNP